MSPGSVVDHACFLQRNGYRLRTVSESVASTDPKSAALTFDDGYADNLEYAVPALAEIGVVGTIYVVTSAIGSDQPSWNQAALGNDRMLTALELAEVSAAGWEIGSHCNSHRRLPTLPEAQQREELKVSKARLEDLLAKPITSLSYPYGSYSDVTARLAEEVGYQNAVTTAKRGGGGTKFTIPRYSLGGYGLRAVKQNFKLKLAVARQRWRG